MTTQVAVVRVVYTQGRASTFTVPLVIHDTTIDDAQKIAWDFIRERYRAMQKKQLVSNDVQSRVVYRLCSVGEDAREVDIEIYAEAAE